VRVHEPINVAGIGRFLQRHVAIRTLRRFGGIVKRTGSLPGHAARLPVVVLIEAANPAIVIHRHIQMDFMACRAELRRLIAHEGLEEYTPVWFWIEIDQKIMQRAHYGILARGHLVKSRIFEIKITLPHGALHLGDGVAHHAAEASLSFRSVHELLDRRIHLARIEHSRIVAAPAPF